MSERSTRPVPPARLRMIEVAERLFAERGLEAVSLREVGQSAGQRNNSAAQYHFGTRDGLVTAVIQHRSELVDGRRALLLQDLLAETPEPELPELIRCFVQPLADVAATATTTRPTWYLRFLAQVMESEAGHTAARLAPRPEHMGTLEQLVLARTGHASPGTRARRWRWLAQVTIRALADHEHELASGRRTAPLDRVVDDLVTMLVALHRAP